MLFRPEEIHLASKESSGEFPRIDLGQRVVYVANSCRWIYFEYLLVLHTDYYRVSTIQAERIDSDLGAGKKPAHG